MLTIDDRDRRIARLKRMLSAEKTARKSLVAQRENKRRHQDPAYRERFRLARRAHDIATGRALPEMSAEQRCRYDNLSRKGLTRAEALADVFPTTPSPSVGTGSPLSVPTPLSPRERARPMAPIPCPSGARTSSPVVAPIPLETVT